MFAPGTVISFCWSEVTKIYVLQKRWKTSGCTVKVTIRVPFIKNKSNMIYCEPGFWQPPSHARKNSEVLVSGNLERLLDPSRSTAKTS